MEEKKMPEWVLPWLAGIVTYLIVGKSLDVLTPSFGTEAKEYIQYGLGIVTGILIKR